MAKVTQFEDLWVWQEARELVRQVHSDVRNTDASKDFAFRDQIQRATLSVMNNVAEGFERSTNLDFARLLDIAKGSCGEVRSLYYVAEDLGYLSARQAQQRRDVTKRLAAAIASLAKYLRHTHRRG